MEGPSKETVQRKPNFYAKLKNTYKEIKIFKPSVSRAPSQPSRTATPVLSAQEELPKMGRNAGVAGTNPEITTTPIDNRGDSPKGSGVAAIPDAQFKPDEDKKTETNPTIVWQAWNIDGDAITQLHKWGGDRENSKWSKLAGLIDRSLKSKTLDTLKAFIPDSPFPAKTLVEALLNLVELGISIPLTQKKVSEFAKEAIEYISTLIVVADEEPSVKEDLKTICAAVNEICLWAKKHVSKKSVSDDLGDWQSKFTSAKERFLATTVTKIRVKQEIDARLASIKETLASHLAANYKHTDQSKSLCAKGTRLELLEYIEQWLLPQPSNAERIFWVTGIPGSGKSTLSATLVENLRENGTPVSAQFFISRNIPETIDPNKIIPTIAQQLASFPTAARVLEKALENGYPAARDKQVTSLLLDPIRELSKSRDVVVVLIDALDELNDAARSVIEILSHITPVDCDLPNNIRFVITSRPEHWADISKSKRLKHAVFKQYSLETELSVTEVHNFVVARMTEITPDEPDWHGWPDPYQLRRLSDKANGLFHYAATALHWIERRIVDDGTACRERVFKEFSKGGLNELEDLYRLVLTSWENVDTPPKDNDRCVTRLDGFQHVMGTIIVLREPLLVREIIVLLSDIPKDKFDVTNFLRQMCSVLIPGTTTSFDDTTPQMHKSFRDYITSERAPPGFQILTGDAHFKIARSCLDIIVKAGSQGGNGNKYAITYWHRHLREAGARCDDESMWMLLGEMENEGVVSVWTRNWDGLDVFMSVASTGWKLLKQKTDELKLVLMSNMLVKIKLLWKDDDLDLWALLVAAWDLWAADLLAKASDDDDIPYTGIWDHSLLETWKHYQSEVLHANIVEIHAESNDK